MTFRNLSRIYKYILVFVILLAQLGALSPLPAQAGTPALIQPSPLVQTFQAGLNKEFSPISIPAGGTATLSVSLFNPNAFALTLSSDPPAWTDNLPTGVYFSSPPDATTTCGGTVTTIGTTLALIGGTVPAQVGITPGSCTVTVHVSSITPGNHINTIPANSLEATDPTGTINITNPTFADATLRVNSVQPPSLSKAFAPNTIWVDGTSTLTITIRNTDTVTDLTGVSLTDNLPTNVTVAAPPASPQCGGTITSTTTSVTMTGGTIPKQAGGTPGTCNIVLTVTSSTAAPYTNVIPASAIQSNQGVTNGSAASAPLNVQSIGVTKPFTPANFQVGGTSTLTITLQNQTTTSYTNVSFIDNFPTGLSVVTPVLSPQCNGGTVTNTATSITLSGGNIPAMTSCTISVTVTSSTAANYTNSLPPGAVTTTQGARNIGTASSNVTVYGVGAGITGSKSFNPGTIIVGGISTLTINLQAPADSQLTNFSVSDALPPGVQVANPPNATKNANCSGGTFTPLAGDTLLTYTGGTIPIGANCRLTVSVTSGTTGTHTNTISPVNISNTQNRNITSNITANLTVSGISISKIFEPGTVNPEGVSRLTITLTNNNTDQIDGVSLSDTLPRKPNPPAAPTSQVLIADPPGESTTCGSGVINAVEGEKTISMTGGTIPAKVGSVPGICTILVDVVGKGAADTLTNTISAGNVSGTIHGTATTVSNPSSASADLKILGITIGVVKGFNPLTVFGNSASTLSIQLDNPNNVPLAGIAFNDSLPQRPPDGGMSIANPPNISIGTCGGTLSATPGNTSFSYSGGSLPAKGICTLSLSVTMNVENNLTNTIGIGAVTTTNGASNTQAANATLTNLPGASVSKYFLTNPIVPGGTSRLRITIQNTSNFPLTGMGLIDDLVSVLPGLTIAIDAAPLQCGGTVSGTAGTSVITLSSGTLAAYGSCNIEVDVTTASAGSFQNCILAGTLQTDQAATNQVDACDTLAAITPPSPPTISKTFSPDPIAAGTTSVLTFTITNPAANTVPLTGVAFTDSFPAGMMLSSIPNPSQCNGSVTSTANSITLAGGSIPVNSSCTVIASVTAATGGDYPNTSGNVTSANGGDGNTASDTLTVIAPPSISKSFADPIASGGVSTLTFTITNPNTAIALTGVSFTDTLPTGVQVAGTPNASNSNCNASSTPVFAPLAGATSLSFSTGSIAASGTCTITVDVTAPNGGNYVNTSSTVTSTNGGTGNTATDTLNVVGAGLSLAKSTTTISYRQVGDTINYSYLLTNTGSLTLYGTGGSGEFIITDDKASVICPLGTISLDSGNSVTCTATYTVQAPDITARSVTNIASATGTDASGGGNTVTSNQSSLTVRLAALTLTKTTPTTGYQQVGNKIRYSYTLTNTGAVTLYSPFQVSDNRIGTPMGTAFNCGSATSLAPGANVSCATDAATDYAVVAGDMTAGSVTNIATATAKDAAAGGNTVSSIPRSVTVYLILPPTISKAFAPNPVAVGGISVLTFTITNPPTNVVLLTGIGFTDNFPAGLTVANAPSAAQCGGTVSSTAASITMAGGTVLASSTCTVTVEVTSVIPGGYPNTSGAVTSTNGGTGTTSNTATLNVVAPPLISKAFSPTSILVGQTSRITFTVTNPNSSAGLTGVSFTDAFPVGLQVANPPNASTAGCGTPVIAPTAADTSLTFSGGSITGGGTCTIAVDVTGTSRGNKDNTTSIITSTEGGPGATSNTARLYVDDPSMTLVKSTTSGNPYSVLGGTIAYQYVLSNNGTVTLIGNGVGGLFTVTDDKATVTCPPTPTGLAPGASVTCTGTHTVTQSDLDVGSVTNIASGHALYGSTPVTSNEDTVTATATQTTGLTLVKSITSGDPYTHVGDLVTYSYLMTNSGNVTLVGNGVGGVFTVSDDQIGSPVGTAFTCGTATSLAPGADISCANIYSVTQTDIDSGSLTNRATGYALFNLTLITSNEETTTALAAQNSDLTLVKSISSGDPFRAVGDVLVFSYILTNNGNLTLTGNGPGGLFTITDDHIGNPPGTAFNCGTATSLAPGGSVTCNADYSITQADRNNESVTNQAIGHGLFRLIPLTSNQASATANVMRGSIEGNKYFDVNGNQTQDSHEPGLSNVTIELYDSTGATLLSSTTTAQNGSYSFPNLLPRQYVVVELTPLGMVNTTPNKVTITVSPGVVARVDFGNYQILGTGTSRITGTVYDDANTSSSWTPGELPLQNVTITLYDKNWNVVATTTTAPDGSYSFINLPPGIFTVVESNPGAYTSTTLNQVSVVLSSGTNRIVNFGDQLNPAVTIIDPAVTKYGDPLSAQTGDIVIFTITVGNNGNTDALNVVVTDSTPAFLNILNINISPNGNFPVNINGNTFTVNFGTLRPIDFYTITVTTVVNGLGAPPGGNNIASIASSSVPDPLQNNNASVYITIPAGPPVVKKEEEEGEDPAILPRTGFSPGKRSLISPTPNVIYTSYGDMTLEIPALSINQTIVGIPKSGNTWDVTWLGNRLGYLAGTAFPTWAGNSVITGHVYGADGQPGPLINLVDLKWGDQLIIRAFGQKYIYEVRSIYITTPVDSSTFMHEDLPWVTLVTCKDFDEKSNTYQHRVVVHAVQIKVEPE